MKSIINLLKFLGSILGIIGIFLLLVLILFPELFLKFWGWTWGEIVVMNQVGTPMILEVITSIVIVVAIAILAIYRYLIKSRK